MEASKTQTLARVENVTVRFGTTLALDSVSLDIACGTTLGIVGGSGSGKTTLARVLLGLTQPTAGQVLIRNAGVDAGKETQHGTQQSQENSGTLEPLDGTEVRKAWQRSLAVVWQNPLAAMNPVLPVYHTISEPLIAQGTETYSEQARAQVLHVCTQVGLDAALLGHFPYELSGGQAQRVALARALLTKPRMLIADEPMSALDTTSRDEMVTMLSDLVRAADHMTFVMISHDMGIVRRLCENMVVLHHGQIVETGSTRDIMANPQHEYTRKLLEAATW